MFCGSRRSVPDAAFRELWESPSESMQRPVSSADPRREPRRTDPAQAISGRIDTFLPSRGQRVPRRISGIMGIAFREKAECADSAERGRLAPVCDLCVAAAGTAPGCRHGPVGRLRCQRRRARFPPREQEAGDGADRAPRLTPKRPTGPWLQPVRGLTALRLAAPTRPRGGGSENAKGRRRGCGTAGRTTLLEETMKAGAEAASACMSDIIACHFHKPFVANTRPSLHGTCDLRSKYFPPACPNGVFLSRPLPGRAAGCPAALPGRGKEIALFSPNALRRSGFVMYFSGSRRANKRPAYACKRGHATHRAGVHSARLLSGPAVASPRAGSSISCILSTASCGRAASFMPAPHL